MSENSARYSYLLLYRYIITYISRQTPKLKVVSWHGKPRMWEIVAHRKGEEEVLLYTILLSISKDHYKKRYRAMHIGEIKLYKPTHRPKLLYIGINKVTVTEQGREFLLVHGKKMWIVQFGRLKSHFVINGFSFRFSMVVNRALLKGNVSLNTYIVKRHYHTIHVEYEAVEIVVFNCVKVSYRNKMLYSRWVMHLHTKLSCWNEKDIYLYICGDVPSNNYELHTFLLHNMNATTIAYHHKSETFKQSCWSINIVVDTYLLLAYAISNWLQNRNIRSEKYCAFAAWPIYVCDINTQTIN